MIRAFGLFVFVVFAAIIAPFAAAENPRPLCPPLEEDEQYHTDIESDFCKFFDNVVRDESGGIRRIFAIYWNGSFLVPDTMKVIVYQHESGDWLVDAIVFERQDREKPRKAIISDVRYIWTRLKPGEAKPVLRWLTPENITRLKTAPDYPPSSVCTDGSSLRVFVHTEIESFESFRHSCVGRTAIDEFAEKVIEAAGHADPVLKERAPPTVMHPE